MNKPQYNPLEMQVSKAKILQTEEAKDMIFMAEMNQIITAKAFKLVGITAEGKGVFKTAQYFAQ